MFVHVSDIHFHFRRNTGGLDREADIAHQLILDAERVVKEIGRCDGVLITGDLTYNGKREEYELAERWLADLCRGLASDPEAIWMVPGNHDVDRPAPPAMRDTLIADLRGNPAGRINDVLRGHLESDDGEAVLFRCLRNYNGFASRYKCGISPRAPVWHYDIPLDDGSTLRLTGLTSALMSNALDDDKAHKLAMGEFQVATLREDPNVVHLVMCHHPIPWLLDAADIEPQLNARARIQLFGHEHRQTLVQIDNCLRVVAGAVSPARDEEPWLPRFNVMTLSIREENAERTLRAQVYPRVWDANERKFVTGQGGSMRDYKLALPNLDRTRMPQVNPALVTLPLEKAAASAAAAEPTRMPRITMSPERRLAYRYFQLPYSVRMEVAVKLSLTADDDQDVPDPELSRRYFERARQKRRLADLWDELGVRLGLAERNPFSEATPEGESSTHA